MRYLTIYKETVRNSISKAAAYRLSFVLGMIVMVLSNIVFPLVTILIYNAGASFEGGLCMRCCWFNLFLQWQTVWQV